MLGRTVIYFFLACLAVFVATLLAGFPQVFAVFLLAPFIAYYLLFRGGEKSKKSLTCIGFSATKSVELFYGRSIHFDDKSEKVALIDGKTMLVTSVYEKPVIKKTGTTSDDAGQNSAVDFEVSFTEKTTGYRRAMKFYDVPFHTFVEIEKALLAAPYLFRAEGRT